MITIEDPEKSIVESTNSDFPPMNPFFQVIVVLNSKEWWQVKVTFSPDTAYAVGGSTRTFWDPAGKKKTH